MKKQTTKYHLSPIPPEALEVLSDALIAASGKASDTPAYSEAQMDRKKRRVGKVEEYFIKGSLEQHPVDMTNAYGDELREDEKSAWYLYNRGYNVSEIAGILDASRPTAVRMVKSAARRLAVREPKLHGLSDIYHEEVYKRLYRRPEHCIEEPCRRLGYCRYALRR